MSKFIPERPPYRRERLIVGYLMLAVFAILFALRIPKLIFHFSLDSAVGALIVSVAAFALPLLVFVLIRGKGYTRTLRLRLPQGCHIPLLIAAFFALFSGTLLLSILCGGFEALGRTAAAMEATDTTSVGGLLLRAPLVAVLPAILEDFLFRGIVVAEYERRGAWRALLFSAMLFALAHFDARNLLAFVFSGVVLTLVLLATNSLLATMLLHALYHVTVLLTHTYLYALYRYTGNVLLFVFAWIVVLLVSLLLFTHFGARLYRRRDEVRLRDPRRDVPWNVQFYTILDALTDPPLLLCLGLAITALIIL